MITYGGMCVRGRKREGESFGPLCGLCHGDKLNSSRLRRQILAILLLYLSSAFCRLAQPSRSFSRSCSILIKRENLAALKLVIGIHLSLTPAFSRNYIGVIAALVNKEVRCVSLRGG